MTQVLKPLRKFSYDQWVEITPDALIPGDLISMGDTTGVFNGLRKETEPKKTTIILATPIERGPISIQLGEAGSNWEFIVRVMDYTGSACERFPDGTAIIAEFERGNIFVYSPRLPLAELNLFCRDNLRVYEEFFSGNFNSIENGEMVFMNPFW